MFRNRLMIALGMLVVASVVLTACAPAATATTAAPGTTVEATEAPVAQTTYDQAYRTGGYALIPLFTRPNFLATSVGLKGAALDSTEYFTWNIETWTVSGADTIVIGNWQEPESFLGYANSQSSRVEVEEVFRPHFVLTQDYSFQANPNLVDGDLPSFDNGMAVLNDVTVAVGDPFFNTQTLAVEKATEEMTLKQLVVTGKIKAGLMWEDGEPLTAHDMVFTWATNCSPDSGSLDTVSCPLDSTPGASGLLVNYEATDDTTLVATYVPGALDPTYFLTPYGPYGVQPAHLFEGMAPADILVDERATGGENATPLGWGAYKMTKWAKGDSMTFEPNSNWSGPAPKTANVVYKYYADSVAIASAVLAGEIDSSSGITGVDITNVPYLSAAAKAENSKIAFEADTNSASFEMLYLNYNDPTDPAFPTAGLEGQKPHPVLSDFNIRKAIGMSLDRQAMVDAIFFGYSSVVEQPQLPQMVSYDPSVGTISYDPAAAMALLDEAGWAAGDDGIRAKDGVRASFNLLTTSGNALRQKSTQIMQASLKAVGIEVNLVYESPSIVFTPDRLYGRNFDAIEFANTFSVVDPGAWFYGVANCTQILTGENGFAGANFAGWCNPAASEAAAHAAYLTADMDERKADWNVVLSAFFSAN